MVALSRHRSGREQHLQSMAAMHLQWRSSMCESSAPILLLHSCAVRRRSTWALLTAALTGSTECITSSGQ